MRDYSNGRSGFDRVLMAVAATFMAVAATAAVPQSVLAQADPVRNNAAELAIDAAIPRPEPANVPPPTASDFKSEITATVSDPATPTDKTPDKAAESKPAEPAINNDTATTTPPAISAPAAVTATPAAE